jgi:hypothetical protein
MEVGGMRMMVSRILLSAALVGALTMIPAQAQEENYYAGKDFEIIVTFAAGGGTDTYARFLAAHLPEFLDASVRVNNITGGRGVLGMTEFHEIRPPDGLTGLVSAGVNKVMWLVDPTVDFDFAQYKPIITAAAGAVVYADPEVAQEPRDLVETDEPLFYGAVGPVGSDLPFLLMFELFDIEARGIEGYAGRSEIRLAFERDEVNFDWQTTSTYRANVEPLVEEGRAVPLFTFGTIEGGEVVRDPAFPDLPTVREVYVDIFGEEPSGPAWDAYVASLTAGFAVQNTLWLRGDSPEEAVTSLRRAAAEMAADPGFQEAAREVVGEYPFFIGEEAEERFAAAIDVSDESLEWMRDFLRENYDVEF